MNSADQHERQILRNGGEAALAAVFERYRDRLERIIQFRLDPRIRMRLDPADVLQEAWLQIARRLHDFLDRGDVSFFVWARQQTVQTLIDLQRGQFRARRSVNREVRGAAGHEGNSTSLSIASFLIGQLTSPSVAAARAEESHRLQNALQSMNDTDREVLALRHFEQLSNHQVAEVLGLSTTAASNRYLRAAARLGEILQSLEKPAE